MRRESVEEDEMTRFVEAKTRREAERKVTLAAKIVKVTGGYMVFDTHAEYETWRQQK